MPTVTRILETALHVEDVQRALAFYQSLFGFEVLGSDDRFAALSVAGRQVLLLFRRGGATVPLQLPGGVIPPHDSHGQSHLAFAIAVADLDAWRQRLAQHQIAVESTVTWPRGGTSLYFRDPDGHLVELATPGIWPIW